MKGAYVMNLGLVPYTEAWELQRSLAGAVSQGAIPDTILLLEHPPTVTTGRRTEASELHIPDGASVELVETDRGGKSTCRDLEEALVQTLAALGLQGQRIEWLTGVWLAPPPRKIASIGIHVAKWITTHGYALNVDLDPAPFTQWITACGLEDTAFTTIAAELDRPVTVDEVRPSALEALAEVFELELEDLPADAGHGLWPQPVHAQLAG